MEELHASAAGTNSRNRSNTSTEMTTATKQPIRALKKSNRTGAGNDENMKCTGRIEAGID